ncbi:uncharacterized protein LOC118414791 [Branchiostoma floridae]|uniref:receptor protein-tyrosine kinase n=3 Tax=Branchiostoma floridae TaxID=7739 RepID=A0A9J7MPL2_BRAFL|nr:uncharacterized protein LOC118414791 [Branchiostoma floridae]
MMPYTVKHQRDFINVSADFMEENGTSIWSLNITKGNDFGRFDVVAETLSIIVTSPLDYEFHSRYNLSLELKNTADNSVWQMNLAILVMDVTGYPPYYNKLCETPVIPDDGTAENYVVMSTMAHLELNGVSSGRFLDIFSYLRQELVDAIMGNCSLRVCAALSSADALDIFELALRRSENRRTGIEWQCRDKEMRSNGRLVGMLNKRYDTLPEWADSGQCFTAESSRYVVLFEVWSAPINWIKCGANVTFFDGNTQFVEFTFQSTIIGCPEGRYGLYCDNDCVCKNGVRCHGFNGACECRPGWRGRACDIPWPEVVIIASPGDSVVKYIGANLTLTCLTPHIHVVNMTWIYKAEIDYNDTKLILNDTKEKGVFVVQNNSIRFKPILESANGEYICVVQGIDGTVVNATFVLNATKCPPNYYGEVCSEKCDCQYGGTCDRWEGCLCPPGRHGDRCEHTCAPGSFGLNCSRNCNCQNNASCDPVNGTCFCAEGQSGEFCENAPKPENNQVVVIVLASVIPAMIILVGSIVIVMLVRRRLETKYTGVDTEMDILSSWEIDKEDISFEHMIGEGEFGHVVRGRLRVPAGYQVLVAAKSIRPDRMTALAVRDFRREMDILARLHEDREGHPNVVKFYGVLTKSEPQYIVVEYATNEELRRYLWSLREEYKVTGHRKLLERLRFASGVASGLSELARLKIVHRDIAARNIVISDRKVAKIADFGLSRDVYVSSAYKRTNQGGEEELLPLKWMALESLRDGVYTCESDVWSYGVLLWEIASFGEEPRYAGGPMHPDVCTLLELLQKGVRLQQSKDCPLSVYRIIRCCWIVDPSKRPTPEELLQKIDQLMPRRDASQS